MKTTTPFFVFVLVLAFVFSVLQTPVLAAKKSYVVYLGSHGEHSMSDKNKVTDTHYDILSSCMGSKEKAKEAIFYSYTNHINGFAAILDEEEATQISKHGLVMSVFPNGASELDTTRSWEFLGVEGNGVIPPNSIWNKAGFGEDIIIANLDTGVWPESQSFNDQGIGPIPLKWKGSCDSGDGVKCNRKLIGARHFNKGYEAAIGRPLNYSENTARDLDGHGTHTLSTAGGSLVPNANLFGSGNGTAKGGAPKARLVSYKVCWPLCYDADILAAFDAAIHDGVDVLSLSIGGGIRDYFSDGIAIGSFHAVRNGIIVVSSAGNSGPALGTTSKLAPWILSVAASTIDREFTSLVTLGNKLQFKGVSFNTNSLSVASYYPLINSVDAKLLNANTTDAQQCLNGSLDPEKVKGKIVYCLAGKIPNVDKSNEVYEAGGVGMILASNLFNGRITPQPHFVPTSYVSAADGLSILSYIYSTNSPTAQISGGTQIGTVAAPIMASFSSAGPNTITPEILKPDITAPGVLILAAYSEGKGLSSVSDNRRVPFNIISGTSMSCPHVSGVAALIKSKYPQWSPSAIMSAIKTTARTKSNVRQPIVDASLVKATPFNYGAGHLRPNQAIDPGLVYDLTTTDYLNFLCSIGYNETQLARFVDDPYQCPSKNMSLLNFNYPSITIPSLRGNVTVTRVLKNVGTPGVYTVRVKAPDGISVKVSPKSLMFKEVNEEMKFEVSFESKKDVKVGFYVFGGIVWSDGKHKVSSPIVVKALART